MDKSILRKWLKAGFLEKHVLHPTEEGTPQGGICSPVIANLALDGLERILLERYPKPKTGYNAHIICIAFQSGREVGTTLAAWIARLRVIPATLGVAQV